MRKFLASVAIVFTLAGTAQAQDFQKGLAAAKRGDWATALQEWRPLAEQGNAGAQNNLGSMYENGWGVPQDYKEAEKWQRRVAEQGFVDAQYNLAHMYYEGLGVAQDYKEAVRWYRKAAAQGDAKAQHNLGVIYGKGGKGVLEDNVLAHMWYNISSANGVERGAKKRDTVAKQMTAEQIAEAQAMARRCMASDYKNCNY